MPPAFCFLLQGIRSAFESLLRTQGALHPTFRRRKVRWPVLLLGHEQSNSPRSRCENCAAPSGRGDRKSTHRISESCPEDLRFGMRTFCVALSTALGVCDQRPGGQIGAVRSMFDGIGNAYLNHTDYDSYKSNAILVSQSSRVRSNCPWRYLRFVLRTAAVVVSQIDAVR